METPAIPKVRIGSLSGFKPIAYLKEVRTELSKVAWPTRAQATRLTLIVIGVSVATALFLGVFDFLFTKLMDMDIDFIIPTKKNNLILDDMKGLAKLPGHSRATGRKGEKIYGFS